MTASFKALNAIRVVTMISLCLIFSGCSHDSSSSSSSSSAGGTTLTRAQMGPQWPFTVDSVELNCSPSGGVILKANGTEYAVDDLAVGEKNADGTAKYPSVAESTILATDPIHPDKKMDYHAALSGGPQGCKK